MGSQSKRTRSKRRLVDPWRGGGLWSAAGKAAAGWQGSSWWTRRQTHSPGSQHRDINPQTSDCKHLWGLRQQREKFPASQESSLETHRGLGHTQAHPPGNLHWRGPLCLWVVEEVTENPKRAEQAPLLPLRPSPRYSVTAQLPALPHPHEHPRLRPFK